MRKIVLSVLAVAILAFVVVVALQPSEFKISRSITVAAPPSALFPLVNDFRRWKDWSPWEKMDPAMIRTFEGPSSGEGAAYAWAGNRDVGVGKMTLLKSQPPERINIQLDFLEPMAATDFAEFTFKPEGTGTVVTWTMSGRNNFISKAICLFMNMDTMVGAQFEKGLAELKSLAEAPAKP